MKADLERLFRDCGFDKQQDPEFVGEIDLGHLAKEHKVAQRANISLQDLVSSVLRKHLPKDPAIRVSPHWDCAKLSEDQLKYAALDAYSVWAVYQTLLSSKEGETVNASTPAGTPVVIFTRDRTQKVALGYVHRDQPKQWEKVTITPSRILINVTSILIPGYKIAANICPTKVETPLSSYRVPTVLVFQTKDVHIHHHEVMENETHVLHQTPSVNTSPHPADYNTQMQEEIVQPISDETDILTDSWSQNLDYDPESEQVLDLTNSDADARRSATALSYIISHPSHIADAVRSRVLGDIWHAMDQFPISVHHGMRRPFARALRDAIFMPDQSDFTAINAVLETRGTSFSSMMLTHSEWVLRRLRRHVPAPEKLLPRVFEVIEKFGPLKDAKTGQPLFNKTCWDLAKNFLENVRRGYYSDPPGVQLYYPQKKDKDGLMRYKCIRGTNGVEGGIHQNIIRRFGAFNASPRFAIALLRDYCLIHNMKVGYFNRTGLSWPGSCDIWILNKLAHITEQLELLDVFQAPENRRYLWINGDAYVRSKETFGILPLSSHARTEMTMQTYDPQFAQAQKMRHQYLASKQLTKFAVLPVHTREEKSLFRMFVGDPKGLFSGPHEPKWLALTAKWSSHADGRNIFYKVLCHHTGSVIA